MADSDSQTTHCNRYFRPRVQVQGWRYDGRRQPWFVILLWSTARSLRGLTASYGSLARFKDIQRLHAVGPSTVIGAGGDMSDFQQLQSTLDEIL
jgi:hypothetical protein